MRIFVGQEADLRGMSLSATPSLIRCRTVIHQVRSARIVIPATPCSPRRVPLPSPLHPVAHPRTTSNSPPRVGKLEGCAQGSGARHHPMNGASWQVSTKWGSRRREYGWASFSAARASSSCSWSSLSRRGRIRALAPKIAVPSGPVPCYQFRRNRARTRS